MPLNRTLLDLARSKVASSSKEAFVPGDPSMMQGGGDPSAGGMPPGAAPMGAPGGDAGGGAGAAAPAPDNSEMIRSIIRQELAASGGGAGGAGAGKPQMKLDVGTELHRINVLLARICDFMQIPIPATDMVTSEDQAQNPSAQNAGATGQLGSAIPPLQPIQGAGPGMEQQAAPKQAEELSPQAKEAERLQKYIDGGEAHDNRAALTLDEHSEALSLLLAARGL